jgi:hypothetical protein
MLYEVWAELLLKYLLKNDKMYSVAIQQFVGGGQ